MKVARPARALLLVSLPLAAAVIVAAVQPGGRSRLAALDAVQPGQWSIRSIDPGIPPRSLCLQEAANLVQIQHGDATCSRFVIENLPKSLTVHYTCPGAGHGRTTINVRGDQQIDILSQGIADNAPFDVRYEAKRTGACAASTVAR